LPARLASARRISQPWSCDASLYDCVRAADGRMLLVGDAASFIEPLSSAGVKKALVSAWRAAVVTNTCLTNSAMAGAAIDLYVRREQEVYADCTRRSTAFFNDAAAAYRSPFWAARADDHPMNVNGDRDEHEEIDDGWAGQEAEIRTAFDRLRAAVRVRLRPAESLRFAPVPAIDGREVVMREGIVVPG